VADRARHRGRWRCDEPGRLAARQRRRRRPRRPAHHPGGAPALRLHRDGLGRGPAHGGGRHRHRALARRAARPVPHVLRAAGLLVPPPRPRMGQTAAGGAPGGDPGRLPPHEPAHAPAAVRATARVPLVAAGRRRLARARERRQVVGRVLRRRLRHPHRAVGPERPAGGRHPPLVGGRDRRRRAAGLPRARADGSGRVRGDMVVLVRDAGCLGPPVGSAQPGRGHHLAARGPALVRALPPADVELPHRAHGGARLPGEPDRFHRPVAPDVVLLEPGRRRCGGLRRRRGLRDDDHLARQPRCSGGSRPWRSSPSSSSARPAATGGPWRSSRAPRPAGSPGW